MYAVGGLMTIVGAAVYITHWSLAPYIYTVGATLFALAQINLPTQSKSLIIKRLRRQQILGAFFLIVAGALMVFLRNNEWIVAFSIGAFIQLYTAFRIPQQEKKEQDGI